MRQQVSRYTYLFDLEQGSKEWFDLRKTKPMTSSNAGAIIAAGIGLRKLCFPVLNKEAKYFTNSHIERGNRLEPIARAFYESATGSKVKEVGFVYNNDISEHSGSSPDGLVGEKGLIEIKCPNNKKYELMLEDFDKGKFKVEVKYYNQMQHQILMTGREWCDYVVYNESSEFPMIVYRVFPDLFVQEKLKTGMKIGDRLISNGI